LTNYCPVYDLFIGKILDKERDEKRSGLEKRGMILGRKKMIA